ncbi:isocitrate lyase/phosphoenolpyruvate mutase family protein [Albimonas sp. CAU 1670]|uniref:isocitrate lyase/PEP mutase family protein n=1 Tax=Albimonas sp. CAU 1670 TaxID=3032599 RepID=UPI0023DBD4DB|nr:isocitrate lyase/phosphoenolpyruvate mutase family protein [Albimonas sp. CAU 1670]MDF2234379.1 isocitrate lyase/phosphoenolpyruvate mutase family protein [Albimonas sp. CAU 1670]
MTAPLTRDEKFARFAALHRPGDPLVLWNAWDAGSAAAVARSGAKAVATGSAAVAGALGFPDGEALPLDLLVTVAERVAEVAGDLPVSIDFEGAYSADPAEAAANALRLARAGVVGVNFEDGVVGGDGLHPASAQAARIAAIVETCAEAGLPLHVNARIDLFIRAGDPALHAGLMDQALERAAAYAEAGAGSIYPITLSDPDLVRRFCAECPVPTNIFGPPGGAEGVARLAALGVGRITYGPRPWREAMAGVEAAARAILG